MDAALLMTSRFWEDSAPLAMGVLPVPMPQDPRLASCVLFETSGSSGVPKWVVLKKPALLASARAVNAHLGVCGGDVWGLSLPVHHVGGFGVCARAYQAQVRLEIFPRRWDPRAFAGWAGAVGVTHHSLVPTQVHDLVKEGLSAPEGLRAIVVGGGKLDEATGEAARRLGWPVLASYGMTEAASQVATQRVEDLSKVYQSSPVPVLPIWKTAVSEDGLLRVSGPALFEGYLLIENGRAVFHERAGDFHQTSDRVRLCDGGLIPLGRADTRVKVLGELVDPEEIEAALAAVSGGVLPRGSFAVVAIPHERAEHALVPVFENHLPEPEVARALADYSATAPGYLRLQAPRFVDQLPRSPLGKLRRAVLAEFLVS